MLWYKTICDVKQKSIIERSRADLVRKKGMGLEGIGLDYFACFTLNMVIDDRQE